MTENTASQELDFVLEAALALVAECPPDDPSAEVGLIYLESRPHG